MALSEVAVVGVEPCVGEAVVVVVKGGASGGGGRALGGRRVLGRMFRHLRACATVCVVVDEGCAAGEGGSVRAPEWRLEWISSWNFQVSSCQPVSRVLSWGWVNGVCSVAYQTHTQAHLYTHHKTIK